MQDTDITFGIYDEAGAKIMRFMLDSSKRQKVKLVLTPWRYKVQNTFLSPDRAVPKEKFFPQTATSVKQIRVKSKKRERGSNL